MPSPTRTVAVFIAGIALIQLALPTNAQTPPLSLAQERAAAKAAGIELSVAALSPPKPPDSENAAPLYLKFERISNDEARANSPFDPTGAKSTPWQLHEQLLDKAGAHPSQMAESEWKDVGDTLVRHAQWIALLRQAAARRTCFLGPHFSNYAKESDALGNTYFPAYAAMREAARLLVSEAMWESHAGHAAEAITDLACCLRMARQLRDDPSLIGNLVANAIDSFAFSGFRNVLRQRGDDPVVCHSVASAIAGNWKTRPVSRTLKFEIAMEQGNVEYLLTLRPADVYPTKPRPTKAKYKRLVAEYGAFALAQMRRCLPLVDKPYAESAKPLRALEHEMDLKYPEKLAISTAFMGYADDDFLRDTDANSRHITVAGAAVFAYHSEYGTFPDTLADAMPNPPTDAFDGKPLHYEVTAKGFVISATHQRPEHKPEPAIFRYPL